MSRWRTVGLVFTRELRERALRRGFLLGTLVTMLIVVAGVALPALLADDGPTEVDLGVVGERPAGLAGDAPALAAAELDVRIEELSSRQEAVERLEADELDLALVEGRELLSDGPPPSATVSALQQAIAQQRTLTALTDAGLSEQVAAQALAVEPLEAVDVGAEGDEGDPFMIAFFATILLVVGVQMSGASLLSGALEEKSGRIVELLVSAARPWQLLTGKVLATSLLTFVQLTLIVGAALVTNAVVETVPLPGVTGGVLTVSAIMLVAGFLFYAALFTVAGTLASSMEDAQSTAGPLYVVMWGTYGAVFAAVIPSPGGIVSQVLSFLPPTAPFVVPARVALGEMAGWQVPVAIAVTLLGALVSMRLAGRIYAASLLSGGRETWRGALRSEPVR